MRRQDGRFQNNYKRLVTTAVTTEAMERKGKERKGKERNFIYVSSSSSAGALIGDTVN